MQFNISIYAPNYPIYMLTLDQSSSEAKVWAITEKEEPWLMGKHRNLEAAIS
ncbi:MAG: hypothetical protein WAK50_09115 [Nitrososphaeraceae archaeon]